MTEYTTRSKRRVATSIPIQPEKLRGVLRRNFLTLSATNDMMGKSNSYMSIVLRKRRMNYYSMDELANVLGMTLNDLFEELVDEQEWLNQ